MNLSELTDREFKSLQRKVEREGVRRQKKQSVLDEKIRKEDARLARKALIALIKREFGKDVKVTVLAKNRLVRVDDKKIDGTAIKEYIEKLGLEKIIYAEWVETDRWSHDGYYSNCIKLRSAKKPHQVIQNLDVIGIACLKVDGIL